MVWLANGTKKLNKKVNPLNVCWKNEALKLRRIGSKYLFNFCCCCSYFFRSLSVSFFRARFLALCRFLLDDGCDILKRFSVVLLSMCSKSNTLHHPWYENSSVILYLCLLCALFFSFIWYSSIFVGMVCLVCLLLFITPSLVVWINVYFWFVAAIVSAGNKCRSNLLCTSKYFQITYRTHEWCNFRWLGWIARDIQFSRQNFVNKRSLCSR